ncbi:MAG: CHRD domain-containing protein [Candidatus Marinimicrobia bacterium]|nr:CHRD domain-containing protein [Candidatus Neomarinimicrobiota bacterium]
MNELLAGRLYINIHTASNPEGEIRGNVMPVILFSSSLSGENVPTPVTTSAHGTGFFFYAGENERIFGYSINVEGLTPTGAHFHQGAVGVTGSILIPVELVDNHAGVGFTSEPLVVENSFVNDLLMGNVYLNIHTDANSGGEIRDQVVMVPQSSRYAILDGAQEVTPVTTTGTGTAIIAVDSDQTRVVYEITISGFDPDLVTLAHFHNASYGSDGEIVKDITFVGGYAEGEWTASDASQPLTPELMAELLAGRIYINVHTNDNPGGEIRGNVFGVQGFTAQLSGEQVVQPVTTDASGTAALFLFPDDLSAGYVLEYQMTVQGLTVTAAHFHNAATGENGSIVKTIIFDGNFGGGEWAWDDTVEPLTSDLVTELLNGNIYVNIHTSAYSGGELRGQVLQGIGSVVIGIEDEQRMMPNSFSLKQNYPNPFNPRTMIEYTLPKSGKVLLTVYNLLGEEVTRLIDKRIAAGVHQVTWDASSVASGIYFYRLKAGDFIRTRKMVVLK